MEEHTPLNGKPNSTPDNETDLVALFVTCCRAIGRGIAAMFRGIGIALSASLGFCVRHFFWLSGGVVGGLLIIISTLLAQKNYVTGEAMLSCYGTSLSDIETEINKLNKMIQSDNMSLKILQSKLGLSPELTRGLKSIQFGYGMDIDNDTIVDFVEYTPGKAKNLYMEKMLKGGNNGDKIIRTPIQQKVPNVFYLKIETNVNDIDSFHKIGHAICNYLNQLPTLQTILEMQRLSWETQIEEIDRQKTLLDSMLRIEYFENSRRKAASYGQGAEKLVLADPKQIGIPFDYKDILSLTEQKSALVALLTNTKQMVNVVSDFQPTPTSSSSQKFGLGLIWIGLFLVIALIYDYRKPIGRYIKEQRQR